MPRVCHELQSEQKQGLQSVKRPDYQLRVPPLEATRKGSREHPREGIRIPIVFAVSLLESLPVKVSIVVPAFNEAKLITASLRQINTASRAFHERPWTTELIVCDNNSTDETPDLAQAEGARVVFEPFNQIGRARNCGAAAADGDWLIFVDADSHPSRELFSEVGDQIATNTCLGGGATVRLDERHVVGQTLTHAWNLIAESCDGPRARSSFVRPRLSARLADSARSSLPRRNWTCPSVYTWSQRQRESVLSFCIATRLRHPRERCTFTRRRIPAIPGQSRLEPEANGSQPRVLSALSMTDVGEAPLWLVELQLPCYG